MDELGIVDPAQFETGEDAAEVESTEKTDVKSTKKNVTTTQGDLKFAGVNPFSVLGRIFGDHFDYNAKDGIAAKNVFQLIFQTPVAESLNKLSKGIRFEVKKSTSGLSSDSYTQIRHENTGKKVYEHLYRKGYDYEVSVYVGDTFLGILTMGNSLYYKNSNGDMIPVSEISREEYMRATTKNFPDGTFNTHNSLNSYEEFINLAKGYKAAAESIISQFEKGKTELNSNDVANLFSKVNMWQGVLDIKAEESEDNNTLVKDLQYLPEGSYILEVPYLDDKRSPASKIRVIGKEGVLKDKPEDLSAFISQNIDKIRNIDQRFILVMPSPDGSYYTNFSLIGLRHSSLTDTDLGETFKALKNKSKTRANNFLDTLYINLKEGENNEKGISIRIKKHTDYSATVYINDKNTRTRTKLGINEKTLKSFNSIEDLVNHINENSDVLKSYDTELTVEDIKTKNIRGDDLTFGYLSENLIAPVPETVAKDFYINFVPQGNIKAETAPAQNKTVTEVKEAKPEVKPAESSTLSEEQELIKTAIDSGVLQGLNKAVATAALASQDSALEFLSNIADQALNKVAPDAASFEDNFNAAIKTYGEELVKYAVEKFSKKSPDDVISDDEFNEFIDTNYVSNDILKSIAEKVATQKELSPREYAIFSSKTDDIEKYISDYYEQVKKANAQVSIDNYKTDLYNLGYEKKDIDNMTVSQAHEIVSKKIQKNINGYFGIFQKIRNLAESLKSDLSEDDKLMIGQEIADLQEQLNSNDLGRLASLIERDFENIVTDLENDNQLEKDCK